MSDDELKDMLKELAMKDSTLATRLPSKPSSMGARFSLKMKSSLRPLNFSMKPVKRVRKDTSMD